MSKSQRWLVFPLLFLTTLFRATAADAPKPFLWRIEGAKPSYVFGTIHLASKDVTTLAPATQKAVDSADALYTEIPMEMADQMKAAVALLGGGKPLSEVLPKDLLERCEAELQRINPALTLQPFERMKIWALAVTLSVLEEQFKNPGAMPLDAILFANAKSAGKEVGGLETIDSQTGLFDQFSAEEQIIMLRATLDEMERARKEGRSPMNEIRAAYLSGDLAKLDSTLNEWMKNFDPKLLEKFNEALFIKRNHGMTESIEAKLKAAPDKSFFFAMGAGHLIGDEGIVKLLEKAGYKVTRVTN